MPCLVLLILPGRFFYKIVLTALGTSIFEALIVLGAFYLHLFMSLTGSYVLIDLSPSHVRGMASFGKHSSKYREREVNGQGLCLDIITRFT